MLDRVERPERMIVVQRIEQIQHRQDHLLERWIEGEDFPRYFLADRLDAVMDVELEVMPEQFGDRQVRRRVSVRRRVGFQDEPPGGGLRMNELVHQARLADAGLADDRHHLAVPLLGELLGAAHLLQFDGAADEAGQAAAGGGLQAAARGAGAGHLVDVDRIGEPLHRERAERLHGKVAFRQPERVRRRQHRAGLRHLLHARGQVGGLADHGVVHVQIVADARNDDFA